MGAGRCRGGSRPRQVHRFRGFRTLVGSAESMDPFTEQLGLRDFRSGRRRVIHFDFTPVYVAQAEQAQQRTVGNTRLMSAT